MRTVTLLIILIVSGISPLPVYAQNVFLTDGYKVTEITDKSAIIWTRLCAQESPNPIIHTRKEAVFRHPLNFNENMDLQKMDGGVKGSGGFVRITLTHGSKIIRSEWQQVFEKDDFTTKVDFNKLKSNTSYKVLIEAKASKFAAINSAQGVFRTAPKDKSIAPVFLTSSTCQYFWSYDDAYRGFQTYDIMNKLHPDFFVQTGDYVYYDKPGPLANNPAKARHKWHAMDAWPALKDFYKKTPAYFLKDDHDLLKDDASPLSASYGDLKFADGLEIWHENVPLRDKPYRTFIWGKDLQIWLVEGREYRSDKNVSDSSRTIWGAEQKAWFEKTINRSDATFKLIFSPTPIVGPDRENKSDNHANQTYEHEGSWIRKFLSDKKNTFIICGDRHWQYVSEDAVTGLKEFGSGPVSDNHAQGWDPKDQRAEHKFLRVKGGFIGIKIDRENKVPFIQFTHYDVDGNPVNEEKYQTQ